MKGYSKLIAEIRRKNEELEEKERQAFQKKQEAEEIQRKLEEEKEKERKKQMQKEEERIERRKSFIRNKVISYLLTTIQQYQILDTKVEKITFNEGIFKQEIIVFGKDVNDVEDSDEIGRDSESFEELFGVKSINQISWAFGVRYSFPTSINQTVADGLFKVIIKFGGSLDFFVNY